jgi:uncharacterized protein (DUF697 family)
MRRQKLENNEQQTPATAVNETPEQTQQNEKTVGARNIIYKYMWFASGASFIPIPVLDMAAVAALQMKMVAELSKHYDIDFMENAGKTVVASLLGSIVPESVAKGTVVSFLKMAPVVGPLMGGVTMSAFAGASSYAIGMVFMKHFETGGTLINFEATQARENCMEMYAKGLELVKGQWQTIEAKKWHWPIKKNEPEVHEVVVTEAVVS